MEKPTLSYEEADEKIKSILERARLLGKFCTLRTFGGTGYAYESVWMPLAEEDQTPPPVSLRLQMSEGSIARGRPVDDLKIDSSLISDIWWNDELDREYSEGRSSLVVAHRRLNYISLYDGRRTENTITPDSNILLPRVEEIFDITERAFAQFG